MVVAWGLERPLWRFMMLDLHGARRVAEARGDVNVNVRVFMMLVELHHVRSAPAPSLTTLPHCWLTQHGTDNLVTFPSQVS